MLLSSPATAEKFWLISRSVRGKETNSSSVIEKKKWGVSLWWSFVGLFQLVSRFWGFFLNFVLFWLYFVCLFVLFSNHFRLLIWEWMAKSLQNMAARTINIMKLICIIEIIHRLSLMMLSPNIHNGVFVKKSQFIGCLWIFVFPSMGIHYIKY